MTKRQDDINFAEGRSAHSALTTRRCFLAVVSTGTVAALAGCSSASGGVPPEPFGDVSAGLVVDLPVGTIKPIPGAPAFVARDGMGLYALTMTCTHNGCGVTVVGSGFHCYCHGSDFDMNGAVRQGPAPDPLAHFAVDVDAAGNITVHGGTQVGADVRRAVA